MSEENKTAVPEEELEKEQTDTEAEADAEAETEDAECGTEKAEAPQEDEAAEAKYMRLMADFQNFKRRAEKEKQNLYSYANEKIVTDLLVVLDNFERALSVDASDEKFKEGMQMIFKQFYDALEKAGLEEIVAEGEDFDPNFHNAVMTEDNADFESGKVTAVLQKGYMLNKKVIRPSMVKVNN